MRTIYKYVIPNVDTINIRIPLSAQILSLETQDDNIVFYAIVDKEDELQKVHEFRLFGTGHELDINPLDYEFLGTAKLYDGRLMFHVFHRFLFVEE